MRADRVEAFAAALAAHAGRAPRRRRPPAQAARRRRPGVRPRPRSSWPTSSTGSSRSASGTRASRCSPRRRRSTRVERIGDGRHVRMAVELGGFRCGAVWFGHGGAARRAAARAAGSTSPTGSRATSGTARRRLRCCVRAVAARGRRRPTPPPPRERDRALRRPRQRRGRPRRRRPDRHRRPPRRGRRARADPRRRRRPPRGDAPRRRFEPSGSARGWVELAEYADRRCRPDRVAVPPRRRARPAVRRGRRRAPRRARLAAATCTSCGAPAEVEFAREVVELRAPLRDGAAPSSGGPTATAQRRHLPAETVERCRTVLREVGLVPASWRRRRVDLERVADLPRRARAGRATRTPICAPRRAGPTQELQHPSTNMWLWQRCRAAPKPSGTTPFWPSCSAGSRSTTRTPTPL